jgi:hypothetical protein
VCLSHIFYVLLSQEFLTAREVVKRVKESHFNAEKFDEIFGKWGCSIPGCDFENSSSTSACEGCGSKNASDTEGATQQALRKIFVDPQWQVVLPMCADLLKDDDTTHLAAFAAVLFGGRVPNLNDTISRITGGDTLELSATGRAGATALAPFLGATTTLKNLKAKGLTDDGMRVLHDALVENMYVYLCPFKYFRLCACAAG